MTDGTALLKAIVNNPDENTPRLMYADWLDENNQQHQAEFIRTQIARTCPAPEAPHRPTLKLMLQLMIPFMGGVATTNTIQDYKHKLARWVEEKHTYDMLPVIELGLWSTKFWTMMPSCLESRESSKRTFTENWNVPGSQHDGDFFTVIYERGLPASILCHAEGIVKHGRDIFELNPITEITLVNKKPIDGKCWVNAGAPARTGRFSLLRRAPRHTQEQTDQGTIPEPIFRCLPNIESYANWTLYKDTETAMKALHTACIRYSRPQIVPIGL